MNPATIIGFISGIALMIVAIYSSTSNVGVFFSPASIAIVFGGIFAATFICYPLKDVLRVFHVFLTTLKKEDLPIGVYISEIEYLAAQSYRKGALQLERELDGIENNFLQDGLQMLVDQYPVPEIESIMTARIENAYEREMHDVSVFRTMAKLSPAFGMAGTLIGLIAMMQSMGKGSFDTLGPGIATALITTFYGILLANLVFYPISVKVERRLEERILLMKIITEGIILIQKRTPPSMITDKLKGFLPPRKWGTIQPREK